MVTITEIERAMCARLSDGLGVMVTDVVSWDVMTDDLALILGRLPGAFITFTGITASVPHDTRRTRYKVTGRFAVYVADYNLRGNESLRHGGARLDEPGCYRMIRAVRRLLAGQDMGLDIGNLRPGTVRMVTGRAFSDAAVALYECLFDTTWYEDCLPNRHWPVRRRVMTTRIMILCGGKGDLMSRRRRTIPPTALSVFRARMSQKTP